MQSLSTVSIVPRTALCILTKRVLTRLYHLSYHYFPEKSTTEFSYIEDLGSGLPASQPHWRYCVYLHN
jgi:hypothetical protein